MTMCPLRLSAAFWAFSHAEHEMRKPSTVDFDNKFKDQPYGLIFQYPI